MGHCQHCQLQSLSLHGVCLAAAFSDKVIYRFCLHLPATSMSGGFGQVAFWPNSEEVFEEASDEAATSDNEGEAPKKKPSINDTAAKKLKPAAKDKASPKKRAAMSKAAPKRSKSRTKKPAASTGELDASSVEDEKQSEKDQMDDEAESEEIQKLSGSDATATTLPLTPSAGMMEKRRRRPLKWRRALGVRSAVGQSEAVQSARIQLPRPVLSPRKRSDGLFGCDLLTLMDRNLTLVWEWECLSLSLSLSTTDHLS